ncbi:MAG: hypothetical protein JWL61_5442 [Gemmatimonadetes bacterium]|nr:hypothetical protein [Gemmatimonadota bacterium]
MTGPAITLTPRDYLEIARFPAVLWKRYLRWIGLPNGARDRVDEMADRVAGYVLDGSLSRDELRAAFLEFDEYSDKRVMLFTAPIGQLKRLRANQFERVIDNLADGVLAPPSPNPRVSYTLFAPPAIRISWTEQHQRWDLSGAVPELVNEAKVIVLDVQTDTGEVSLAFDKPARHVHGTGPLDYFSYYIQLATETLGCELTAVSLYKAIAAIEPLSDLVRIRQERIKGMQGRMTITADVPDVRQMGWYAGLRADPALREQARFHWLESPEEARSPRACALFREVPTELIAPTGTIKFTQHTLAHEVEYVLGHVRANA